MSAAVKHKFSDSSSDESNSNPTVRQNGPRPKKRRMFVSVESGSSDEEDTAAPADEGISPEVRNGVHTQPRPNASPAAPTNNGVFPKIKIRLKSPTKNMFLKSPTNSVTVKSTTISADSRSPWTNCATTGVNNGHRRHKERESDAISSDDDDEFNITAHKKQMIIELLQESTEEELMTISKCSSKKAKTIISIRPFPSWEDLVDKLDTTRLMNRDLLWSCIDLLKERKTLCSLMSKCGRISMKLEEEFAKLREESQLGNQSSTISIQPQNISPKFSLKPYQMIGLNWLALLQRNNLNGILADEMGLGKTIQTISYIAYMLDMKISEGPHLIIVPSSTLDNWKREFDEWCPSIRVVEYVGPQHERRELRSSLLRQFTDCNVILTTYNLSVSSPEDRSFFRKFGAHTAIFDEGHMLKNMSSQRYQHLLRIKAQQKILLTGTPLQNNLLELMSLLKFVMPDMFDESTTTLVRIFKNNNDDPNSKFSRQRINQARQIMQPFVLRRLKRDVLSQLPEKKERIIFPKFTDTQVDLYEKVRSLFKDKVTKSQMSKHELRNVFVELRKVANHPLLRRELYTNSKLRNMSKLIKNDVDYMDCTEDVVYEDMQVMSDFELHNLCLSSRAISNMALQPAAILDSGKIQHLEELLPGFKRQGKRVLLFSQFTMMMDILEVYCKHRGHQYLRLDGQTPVQERLILIDSFNKDPTIFLFLLSTKAGGLGINLTSASVIILHDIDCNPYNDKQAEDRCHRVGQTKTVEVIKLIAADSIEVGMFKTAQQKLQLEKDMSKIDEDSIDWAMLITKALEV